jgi:FkbM family methyltransferase
MRRGLSYYLQNLMLVERNREWLSSDIKWKYKWGYYPALVGSYCRILSKKRRIKYLGRRFAFDNVATPFNLQNYPFEISRKILANMDAHPKSVLDIGGNLGQFSVTMKHLLGRAAQIDIFEPNGKIFLLLEQNVAGLEHVRAYNYGLGEAVAGHETATMYYEPGRSATGSLIRGNASDQTETVSGVEVVLVSSVAPVTGKNTYDLVKIDVEGYELHVLRALAQIQMKYLFLEVSLDRVRDYAHSELYSTMERAFGPFDIVYSSAVSKNAITYDILLRFAGDLTPGHASSQYAKVP